jgi:pimeloyl-ACP methyl ester carboxylesterase
VSDLEAALLWASTQAHYNAERIAVGGHSMGAFAAQAYASQYPGLSAVVAISGGGVLSGPHMPPNVLYIFADSDLPNIRDGAREAGAQLAGLDRVVLEKTYGEISRGTAVQVSEVPGTNHTTILYSAEAGRRIAAWLRQTLGPGDPPVDKADGRMLWTFTALVAYFVLFSGLLVVLIPFAPRVELPAVAQPLRALGLLLAGLVAGILLLVGVDTIASGAFIFIPLLGGAETAGYLGTVGLLLCIVLARRGQLPTAGLFAPRTWASAALLLGFTYVVVGTALQTISDAWLPSHRAPLALACGLLVLPFFAALEWLLRSADRTGVWAPIVGKLLVLLTLGVGATSGLLPGFLMLILSIFALFYVAFEICCWRISRTTPNPWIAAIFQAGWAGWTLGSMFPIY